MSDRLRPKSPPPAGVVLAAGASTRMGSPKALLDLGGATALELCVRALRDGGCSPVAVVLGAAADEIPVPPACLAVLHAGWASGRTGTLKAGLRAVSAAPAAVMLPVDHPLATAADVAALVEAWRESRPPVVRPVRDGRGGHPVLLDAALYGEVATLGDDAPLRDLLRRHRDREVTVPGSPGVLVNVDTPEDAEAARRASK